MLGVVEREAQVDRYVFLIKGKKRPMEKKCNKHFGARLGNAGQEPRGGGQSYSSRAAYSRDEKGDCQRSAAPASYRNATQRGFSGK